MSDRRIPISLKVPEDEFFYDFIEPKRISKELSPFIYQVLRAYFEDDSVKAAVKPHLTIQNEDKLAFLNAELNRVAMEHSATIMDTQALQDEIEDKKQEILSAVQDAYGTGESAEGSSNGADNAKEQQQLLGLPSQKQQFIQENNAELDALKGRMDKMESKVDSMDSNISTILSLLQGKQTQNTVEPVAEPVTVPTVTEPLNKPVMEEPENQGVQQSVAEGNISEETKEVEKTAEGQQVGKVSPAFNKLMGSLHKS